MCADELEHEKVIFGDIIMSILSGISLLTKSIFRVFKGKWSTILNHRPSTSLTHLFSFCEIDLLFFLL